MISPRNFSDFVGEKYLVRNLFAISSHVAIDSIGKDLNHIRTLSLSEKEKIINLTVSTGTPLYFCVSQISRKFEICLYASSLGRPQN